MDSIGKPFAVERREKRAIQMEWEEDLRQRGLKPCPKCGTVKEESDFQAKIGGRICRWCSTCRRAATVGTRRKRARIRKEQKSECLDLLGNQCGRCGYHEFIGSLEFHHVEGGKEEEISKILSYTVAKGEITEHLRQELDKCAVLCSNCHQALHHGAWDPRWVKRDGTGWAIEGSSMSRLGFNNGVKIDLTGPLRLLHLKDGWYVVGQGMIFPARSEQHAEEILESFTEGDDDAI